MRATSRLALVVLLLAACGSPGGKHPEPEMVPIEALPERKREVWETFVRGGGPWEIEREKVRRDPVLARFLVENLVIHMVRGYESDQIAKAGERASVFDRAQAELVELSEISTALLVELVVVRDGIVAYLATDTLIRIGARAVLPAAKLLDDPAPELRRRAAELLGSLPHAGDAEPGVLEALGTRAEKDEAWIVRAQSARSLGARARVHEHQGYAFAVLTRALADPDSAVVQSAALGLAKLGEPRAIPALVRALEQAAAAGQVSGVQGIQAALRSLSGVPRDQDPPEWWRWWKDHEADFARPGAAPGSAANAGNATRPRANARDR